MSKQFTAATVRSAVKDFVRETKQSFQRDEFQKDTNRNDVIEYIDSQCDSMWGSLVYHGRIDQYDVDTLIQTATECAVILKVAQEDAWVETDRGLWEGLTYGVLASMAYFSLRNLLYKALKDAGIDSNDDEPFSKMRRRNIP